MTKPLRVALLGFGAFEQGALAAFLALHAHHEPAFEVVDEAADAELWLVCTDTPGQVERAERDGRVERTVFVGSTLPPEEALAWLSRPFDPIWLLRELDVLVALRRSALMREADTVPSQLASMLDDTDDHDHDSADDAHAPEADLPDTVTDPPMLTEELSAEEAATIPGALGPDTRPPPLPPQEVRPASKQARPGAPALLPPTAASTLEAGKSAAAPTPAVTASPMAPDASPERPAPVAPAGPEAPAPSEAPAPAPARRAARMPKVWRTRPMPMPGSVSHPKALLVDDSEIALRFLELRLQGLGMETLTAGNSRDAAALLARHSFDVAFVDIDLGELDDQGGLMLCQQIKHGPLHRDDKPPKVVMVTGHASATMRVRAELAGADGFLPKPIDATKLRGLLRQLDLGGSA